ncbi:MAG: hypothetical protein P1P69_01360 [Methanosarcinaceae archaeon]|nr:hypothetical protein [Methanosarcinaceae archaeon]MDF1533135.1 hypothetical protein [Methanosarcinaceae archaeon]
MKSLAAIMILLIAAFALAIMPSSTVIDDEQFIHVTQMVVTFEKVDGIVEITYDLDPFAKAYVFLLGSRNLGPTFEDIFFEFEDVEIIEIGQNYAVVMVKNVSRQNGEYYLHDSHELGISVDLLTFIYPDGTTKQLEHTRTTQNTFYSDV